MGGHPFSSGLGGSSRITALAMSADGQTLASMGGVVLLWSVAPSFIDSRAVYLSYAIPEWPRLEISPDGRWLAISGDGWRLISRDGKRGPYLSFPDAETCWPAQLLFSPDGQWLVGTGFRPGFGVFRAADLDQLPETTIAPVAALPAPCGPPGAETYLSSTTRLAFTPDSQTLVAETGARYRTSDWQLVVEPQVLPLDHGLSGALTVSADGTPLLSDCRETCRPYPGRFPQYSADGSWILAGGTLRHVRTGSVQVLDPSSPVGIFTPTGDVIAASDDNTLTRYCRSE
jgi:WD40 repeat protein